MGSIYQCGEKVADRQGFDIRARRIDKQKYFIESKKSEYPVCYKHRIALSQQYLGKGTKLVRYGSETGHYTTLNGTEFNQLGLPYVQDTVEFHKYEVLKDVPVICIEVIDTQEQQRILDIKNGKIQPDIQNAVEGIVAPAFGSWGGAVQYYHDMRIKDLLGIVLEKIR